MELSVHLLASSLWSHLFLYLHLFFLLILSLIYSSTTFLHSQFWFYTTWDPPKWIMDPVCLWSTNLWKTSACNQIWTGSHTDTATVWSCFRPSLYFYSEALASMSNVGVQMDLLLYILELWSNQSCRNFDDYVWIILVCKN